MLIDGLFSIFEFNSLFGKIFVFFPLVLVTPSLRLNSSIFNTKKLKEGLPHRFIVFSSYAANSRNLAVWVEGLAKEKLLMHGSQEQWQRRDSERKICPPSQSPSDHLF